MLPFLLSLCLLLLLSSYSKALVMSNDNRKESSVGETVNLMSADAQRFNDLTSFIHLLWSCPLQIILSIAFLWMELGPSALAGLAAMVILVPLNALLATKARSLGVSRIRIAVIALESNVLCIIIIITYHNYCQEIVKVKLLSAKKPSSICLFQTLCFATWK